MINSFIITLFYSSITFNGLTHQVHTDHATKKKPILSRVTTQQPSFSITPLKVRTKIIRQLRAPEITILININTADAQQLQQLPTIGPKRALAIIKYREQLATKQFDSIEQLLDIPSITLHAFQGIRAYIVI